MVVSDWYALEAGWVPDVESGLLRASPEPWRPATCNLSFIAEISRYNQELLFNSPSPLAS